MEYDDHRKEETTAELIFERTASYLAAAAACAWMRDRAETPRIVAARSGKRLILSFTLSADDDLAATHKALRTVVEEFGRLIASDANVRPAR